MPWSIVQPTLSLQVIFIMSLTQNPWSLTLRRLFRPRTRIIDTLCAYFFLSRLLCWNFIIQLNGMFLRDLNREALCVDCSPFKIPEMTFLAIGNLLREVSITFLVRDKCLLIKFYCYFFIFNLIRRGIQYQQWPWDLWLWLSELFRKITKRDVFFKMKFVPMSEKPKMDLFVCVAFYWPLSPVIWYLFGFNKKKTLIGVHC